MVTGGMVFPARAQVTDSINRSYQDRYWNLRYRQTGIITGFHWQPSLQKDLGVFRYVEIGVSRMIHQSTRHGPVSAGWYLSEEIYPGQQPIFGTKLGLFTHYLVDLGFSAVFYTDLTYGNLKLRPEMGIGMGNFRTVIGFNFPTIRNRDFYRLQKNYGQLSIQYSWPVKKVKTGTEGSIFNDLFKKKRNGNSEDHLGGR